MSSNNEALNLNRNLSPRQAHELEMVDGQIPGYTFRMNGLFESSLVESTREYRTGGPRSRTLALSVLIHAAVLTAVAMIPLIYYESLPDGHQLLANLLVSPPTLSRAQIPTPPQAPTKQMSKPSALAPARLLTPLEVPKEIPPAPKNQDASSVAQATGIGIPGGAQGGLIALRGDPGALLSEPPGKPQPPRRGPYRVNEGVLPPSLIRSEDPSYTDEARKAKVQGLVILETVILRDGTIGDVRVLKGLGFGLDQSAIETVKSRWRFKPGTKDGEAVDVIVTVKVFFELH